MSKIPFIILSPYLVPTTVPLLLIAIRFRMHPMPVGRDFGVQIRIYGNTLSARWRETEYVGKGGRKA